jgi:hypothetical protein
MEQLFTAVPNLDWQGLPPAVGRPVQEKSFTSIDAARAWLKERKSGGAISGFDPGINDFRVFEIVRPG